MLNINSTLWTWDVLYWDIVVFWGWYIMKELKEYGNTLEKSIQRRKIIYKKHKSGEVLSQESRPFSNDDLSFPRLQDS